MRVLHPYGVLIFKWSENQISTADVLKLLPVHPLFGNRRGKAIWLVFMKFPCEVRADHEGCGNPMLLDDDIPF